MNKEQKKEDQSEQMLSDTIIRVSAIDTEINLKERSSKEQESDNGFNTLNLPKEYRKRKMQSHDFNCDPKLNILKNALKNSSSSSQLILSSKKKVSLISKSRKNSQINSKSIFKKSSESMKSLSVQKHTFTDCHKLSNQKNGKLKNLKTNFNVSMFHCKMNRKNKSNACFRLHNNSKNEIDMKKEAQKIFGSKNYSNFGNKKNINNLSEKKKNLISGKNSSNVQSENNLKRSFGQNLTEKFESSKKPKIAKNESFGCLFEHSKKTSDNFKKKKGSLLQINQKIIKRNKSHANHFENVGFSNFTSIPKQKTDSNKKFSKFIFENQKLNSNHKASKKTYSSNLIRNVTSNENNQNNEIQFIDKSIEADRDLYNEEHANLYEESNTQICQNCVDILIEIKSKCEFCYKKLGINQEVMNSDIFETCENCAKNFEKKTNNCRCALDTRERNITFGKVHHQIINSECFSPQMGESIKNLDQLDLIELCENKSIKLNINIAKKKKNNSDNFDYNNISGVLNQTDSDCYLKNYPHHNSMMEPNITPPLQIENSEFKKDDISLKDFPKHKNIAKRNFFISSPIENGQNFKFSHNSNNLNPTLNTYGMKIKKSKGSFLISDNSAPSLARINSQNSSKLQIKIQENKNKSLRKDLTNFSKSNIPAALHRKLKIKLNNTNKTDLFNTSKSKKYVQKAKLSNSNLKSDQISFIKDLKGLNQIEISHREKSLNPFQNKNRLMKRNHTTKNLRNIQLNAFKINNPGTSMFLDNYRNKQLLNISKPKILTKNFNISTEKIMKSTLIQNIPKNKKFKKIDFPKDSHQRLKKSDDSFYKTKQKKRIKNSFSKIQTPKGNIKLKKKFNQKTLKESTLNSLQKVSENEEEAENEAINISEKEKKIMRNGSKSLSAGNLTSSRSPEKMNGDRTFKRAETLKRSVAVKQLKIISNEELQMDIKINEERIYEIESEEESENEKNFSQSGTNFKKNKYFTLNKSVKEFDENLVSMSMSRSNKKKGMNCESLNISTRNKNSQDDLNIHEYNSKMSFSQSIQKADYLNQIEVSKNSSLTGKNFENKILKEGMSSNEYLDSHKNSIKNSLIRKNISLMNSKERKLDKNFVTKEFKIGKMKSKNHKFENMFGKNYFNKKDIERKIMNQRKVLDKNYKPKYKDVLKKDFPKKINESIEYEIKNQKKQKKSINNFSKPVVPNKNFLMHPKKIMKISVPKDKYSQRDINNQTQNLPFSREEINLENNNFKKKKFLKQKNIKKEIKNHQIKNITLSSKFEKNLENMKNETKKMTSNLLDKNQEMEKTWIKNHAYPKDLIIGNNKLKNTKSRKKLPKAKISEAFYNKIKKFCSKDEPKKPKKSKQKEENKTKTQINQNETDNNKTDKQVQKISRLSKIKSSAHLKLFGKVNQKEEERAAKFLEMKKLRETKTIDKEEIKNSEFKNFLPNYTKYDMLGKGSYAEVYICHSKDTNELVAIKIYERYKINDEIRKENLKNEIEILKMIDHKNIIKLIDHIKGDNLEFIIMENGPQRMLSEFAKQFYDHRLPSYELKIIFEQIVEATYYLHKKNISHRDLKLENILVDQKLVVKLIDFGFATKVQEKEKLKVFCGTYSYMAPELVSKIHYDGKASDVWSLGVILYLLVVGDYPFKGTSEREITHNINNLNYYLPSSLDPNLKELIQSIFVTNPEERLTADEILSSDWLLIDDGKSYDMKDNQSTIFMESTDCID